ncbi:MAG: YARHG domain-containing protein [Clostridia bacterium]|nr:YARHG domain-containing protein [Clostridia bacterium]
MKKILSIILALLFLLSCAAYAEVDAISGNISSGGIAAVDASGALWYSMDGLKRLNPDGSVDSVAEGFARFLQSDGESIYYVLYTPDNVEPYLIDGEESLWVIGADGEPRQIGETRTVSQIRDYDPETGHLSSGATYTGYGDLTVYGDYIYFIGNDGVPGSYRSTALNWIEEGEVEYETAYAGSAAVYRMKKDGSDLTCLIPGLGNGYAHMAIANGRIAVSSCWLNPVYAYDFSNFMLYDMEGKLLSTVSNASESRHSWIFKQEEEFTVIVNSIQTDGEKIYASLSDSEGDFASSRLVDVEDIESNIAIEAFYTPSIVTPDAIYYVTADVEDTFWVENMEYTTVLRCRAADGTDTLLAHIPHNYIGQQMSMALIDGKLYLSSKYIDSFYNYDLGVMPEAGKLLRVDLSTGAVDELTDLGFSVSMACDPEFYTAPVLAWNDPAAEEYEEDYIEGSFLLPDSDVYLYSADELEMYDAETLALMRNEILARHGYVFQKEAYREYFGSQGWYSENPDFSYDQLNAVEMENVETIKALEAAK